MRITKIIAVLLLIATLFSISACSRGVTYTLEETLTNGQGMLFTTEEKPIDVTLDYVKDNNYEYIVSGHSYGNQAIFSLSIIHNGLINNYKNLVLVQNDNLYINLNNALTIAEVEADFIFSESLELQGKYLEITGGAKLFRELAQEMLDKQKDVMPHSDDAVTRGTYSHSFQYSHDESKKITDNIAAKVAEMQEQIQTSLDKCVKDNVGDKFDAYDKAMAYLGDCVDIDTAEVSGEYKLLGEQVSLATVEEAKTYANLMELDGYYITEGCTYDETTLPQFEYSIGFCDDAGEQFSNLTLTVAQTEAIDESLEQMSKSSYTIIKGDTFVDIFLTNVENAKGVGYETEDFPYTVSYTESELTLNEENDLYHAAYVFTFNGRNISKYTVTIYTYELYMHNALREKYEDSMGFKLIKNDTAALSAGTGSGYLQFEDADVGATYTAATNPVDLLTIIKTEGLPSYAN